MPPSGPQSRLYCSLTSTNKYVYVRVLINTLQYGHHLYTVIGFIIYNPIFIYLFIFKLLFVCFYDFSNRTRVRVPFTGLWNLRLVI